MPHANDDAPDTEKIRAVISDFLQQRLQPKLDKLKEGEKEKRQKLHEDYQPSTWIADAARRVRQIQQVTHALKYIHPDAKGTNLSSLGNQQAGDFLVGTHTNSEQCPPDVVGNAAALDVYKFLRLKFGGKTLLSRATENDPALQAALSDDGEQAGAWMESFASLTASKSGPSSHKLAKQIFWPVENGYHLLAPLFPTSLVHQVWTDIREDRFSEEAKAARDARRNNQPHPHGYCEYPNIVVQKFGGTKPQNISQLNSERYGENYLLPSLPPKWKSQGVKPPLHVDSVFDDWFGRRTRVKGLVKALRGFLLSVEAVYSNVHIRTKRAELVGYIVDEILLFADELRDLDDVWTLRESCKLNIHEQCWFNPMRAESDEAFSKVYQQGDWKEAVCKRFASWLTARLRDSKQPLPLDEYATNKWEADLEKELRMLRMEVDHYG